MKSSHLRAGERVRVRSKEEILRTLNSQGMLEGLPFMPEMFAFCGREFSVFKRSHKTCDPPNGQAGRRMLNTVHLDDLRCDGAAHGGCQARCLMYWKEAWLERIGGSHNGRSEIVTAKGCEERDVVAAACIPPVAPETEPVYVCQSTRVAQATQPLRWWDFRQYVEDYTSGNVTISQMIGAGFFFFYAHLVSSGLGFGAALRWFYDAFQKVRGGSPYPLRDGTIPRGTKTPSLKLDLQPGELVRIKSYEDILKTIDEERQNRGMWFDAEMVPYCGETHRVLDRVSHIIDEKTGKMVRFKNDCIMLEQVVCRSCYSKYRKFCPRSIFSYWREIWLERVN